MPIATPARLGSRWGVREGRKPVHGLAGVVPSIVQSHRPATSCAATRKYFFDGLRCATRSDNHTVETAVVLALLRSIAMRKEGCALCPPAVSYGARSLSCLRSCCSRSGSRRSGSRDGLAFSRNSARPGSLLPDGRSIRRRPSSGGGSSMMSTRRTSFWRARGLPSRAASLRSPSPSSCRSTGRAKPRT